MTLVCSRLSEYLQVALLLLVAGYQHYEKLGDLDAEGLQVHFEMNAIGPILVAQSLRPNLEAGSKVGVQEANSVLYEKTSSS